MRLIDMMDGCQDAQNWPGVAACVLAHPASRLMPEAAVSRFFGFAFNGAEIGPCDQLMIEIMADVVGKFERAA